MQVFNNKAQALQREGITSNLYNKRVNAADYCFDLDNNNVIPPALKFKSTKNEKYGKIPLNGQTREFYLS